MTKVITYGTYDLMHEGHIRLLERARALGDYLIVGVTADGFDLARGKINVQQSLIERIEAVKATGLADQIVIEEYEGQKIDDIRKFDVDIFTVGSDWIGRFDYLKEYCDVVYLDRTEGISSSMLRSNLRQLRIGIIGENRLVNKFFTESQYVNGVTISGVFSLNPGLLIPDLQDKAVSSLDQLFDVSDAIYVASTPENHYAHVEMCLKNGLHTLCEAPVTLTTEAFKRLMALAEKGHVVLMEGLKTAYSLAFQRLMLLVKGGIVGEVIAIDATCTSLVERITPYTWSSLCYWGPTALLPITDIFGCDYESLAIVTKQAITNEKFDLFTHLTLTYPHGVATAKVAQGVKSEGDLVISGTKGYIYVPSPWWKTDYFEIRYENPADNRRYFYQLEGEGIRHNIRSFIQLINGHKSAGHISTRQSETMIRIIEEMKSPNVHRL